MDKIVNERLVSVIVPVYNAEKYLNRCLQSICSQSYRHIEVLLVDDGSQDTSPELCNVWTHKDSRIRVIHQPNKGVSAARNAGLLQCSGSVCTFVDADDYLAPCFIERLLLSMKDAQLSISGTKYCPVEAEPDGNVPATCTPVYFEINREFDISKIQYSNACWGILYDLNVIREHNIQFNEIYRYSEDSLFFYEVMSFSSQICYLQEPLYIHTVNPAGSSGGVWKSQRYTGILSMEEKIKLVRNYPKVYLYERVHYIGVCLSMLIELLRGNGEKNCVRLETKKVKKRFSP